MQVYREKKKPKATHCNKRKQSTKLDQMMTQVLEIERFKITMNTLLNTVVENWTICITRFQQKNWNYKKNQMDNLEVKIMVEEKMVEEIKSFQNIHWTHLMINLTSPD